MVLITTGGRAKTDVNCYQPLPLLVLVLVEASEVPTLDEVGVAVCEMDGRVTVVEVGGVSWAAVAARVSRAELSRPSMLDMAGRTSPSGQQHHFTFLVATSHRKHSENQETTIIHSFLVSSYLYIQQYCVWHTKETQCT
jgi:hypothetical protein